MHHAVKPLEVRNVVRHRVQITKRVPHRAPPNRRSLHLPPPQNPLVLQIWKLVNIQNGVQLVCITTLNTAFTERLKPKCADDAAVQVVLQHLASIHKY